MGFKETWNEQNIRAGLERFKLEHGRYPSAREFDTTDYLPTARQIQRKYGGLPAFRTVFNLGETDLTKGAARSEIALKTFTRSYEYEEAFYNFLISSLPEELVHEQKRIRPGNVNCDFFIYNLEEKKKSITIDVFYAENLYNLAGIVNIKIKRYIKIPYSTYLVSIGNKISQEDIQKLIENKRASLPNNIQVCSEDWFKNNLHRILGGA